MMTCEISLRTSSTPPHCAFTFLDSASFSQFIRSPLGLGFFMTALSLVPQLAPRFIVHCDRLVLHSDASLVQIKPMQLGLATHRMPLARMVADGPEIRAREGKSGRCDGGGQEEETRSGRRPVFFIPERDIDFGCESRYRRIPLSGLLWRVSMSCMHSPLMVRSTPR